MARKLKKEIKMKLGRPKKEFTKAKIDKIADYALHGCQNNTIATLIDIPVNTLTRHFGKLLTKKRAERKYELRKAQDEKALSGDTGMLCFLGKNELGQADKQEVVHSFDWRSLTKNGSDSNANKGPGKADS